MSAILRRLFHSFVTADLGKRSAWGSSYCNEELKQLSRLLGALPDSIPLSDAHNFLDYVRNPEKVQDYGCVKSVLNCALELSFGSRRTQAGETIWTAFKSRRSLGEWAVDSTKSGGMG